MPRNQRHNVDVQQVPRTEAETHEEGDGKAIFLFIFLFISLFIFVGRRNAKFGGR